MLRYLLDTNIVIYVLKRRPVEVLSTFNINASRMAISSVTLAELLHGAEKSSRVSENLAAIEDFCSRLEVLPYGPQGRATLRSHSRRLGKTRPAYWCERHAHCSARPQRRPGAGDEQHGGVRTGACAGSRELGPHSAVIYELSCISRTKVRRLPRQVCRDSCGGPATDLGRDCHADSSQAESCRCLQHTKVTAFAASPSPKV